MSLTECPSCGKETSIVCDAVIVVFIDLAGELDHLPEFEVPATGNCLECGAEINLSEIRKGKDWEINEDLVIKK